MTDTQKKVADIWAAVIPNRTARMFVPTSNFFDEGGHSILAQQMLFRVRSEWAGIDLPMSVIFTSQTVEAFAAEIERGLDPTGLRLDAAMPLPSGHSAEITDEAYAADARDLATQLPASIAAAGTEQGTAQPFVVFLTGATGFLGSFVLRELLTHSPTTCRVIALVRCASADAGLDRLEAVCRAYGFWDDEWRTNQRVQVVPGDIAKRGLGMTEKDWTFVAQSADVVLHNGAQVNWMLPYSSLRAANVLSTVDCIALCASSKPKRLAFVSSTSALDNDHYTKLSQQSVANNGTGVLESDTLEGSRRGLATGYGQGKWASEYIVREAGKRGLSGTIIRPGYVSGDPDSGATVTDDFLVRLWKGCVQVGARPDIGNSVNQVPVTQVARIVVASALSCPQSVDGNETNALPVVQVTSHPRLTLNDWLGTLQEYGYPVPMVPYAEWSQRVRDYVGTDLSSSSGREEHALLPLLHFVTDNLPADSIAPELDDRNAAVVMERYGQSLEKSAVTQEAMGRYLAYLVAVGFMDGPAKGSGRREVPECRVAPGVLATLGGRGGAK